MTNLTREKVVGEIDQLAHRASQIDHRLRNMENDERYRHLSFIEVRAEYDEAAQEIRLAKQLTCSNRIDFRQVELILTEERQSLSAISHALDRVEHETANASNQ